MFSWSLTAPPTTAAALSSSPTTSRYCSCRPTPRNSIRRKISGMKSARKSSRTTPSSWPFAPSSSRRSSTSNAIPKPCNPSRPSPISSSHSDLEMVSGSSPERHAVRQAELRLRSTNPQQLRHYHQFRQRSRLHFLHQIASMQLHRDLAHTQLRRYLLVHEASRHQPGHLLLARSKCLIKSSHPCQFAFVLASSAIPLKCNSNGVQHILITEWLGEELDSAGLHCPHRHWYVTMARQTYDWNLDVGLDELSLKLKPA